MTHLGRRVRAGVAALFRAMSTEPTANDPLLVTASDGTLFVCWVEVRGKTKPEKRWVAMSADRVRFDVGRHRDEESPDDICRMIDEWWENTKSLGLSITEALRSTLDAHPARKLMPQDYKYKGGPLDGRPVALEADVAIPEFIKDCEWPNGVGYALDRERRQYIWRLTGSSRNRN
jgi:hypothetical protein